MSPLFFSTMLAVALTLSGATDLFSASPLQTATAPGWISPNLLLVLNQDQFSGSWKQFKGELKQKWGEFTDDDLLYIEGRYDKYEGRLQERYGDRKEEIKQWTDEWFKKHHFEQDGQKTP
jgi:uncharacterized protein YjbJ (UPF0337 family)